MATSNTTMDTHRNAAPTGADDGAVVTAKQVADTVASAAGEAAARMPDVAQGTRDALTEANPANRARYLPGSRGSNIGFRLARGLE